MYSYLNVVNIANLKVPDQNQVASSREAGASMTSWPEIGSVKEVNGVVIVKLSNSISTYNR